MESELCGIGEMARASGLSVSALRFYDNAGLLTPAVVDPHTGYRRYARRQVTPARLLASLRRVGMPLAEIAEVLDRWPAQEAVVRLLDAHLHRLELGLADARRELSRVRTLLDREEIGMSVTTLTLTAPGLAAALDAVRFAVGCDPRLPMLGGVLFDVEDGVLRLVATDRYRLALSRADARTVTGPPATALAPIGFVDELRRLLTPGRIPATGHDLHPNRHEEGTTGHQVPSTWHGTPPAGDEVTLHLDGTSIRAAIAGPAPDVLELTTEVLPYDFPDYRRLADRVRTAGRTREVTVSARQLSAELTAGPTATVIREHDGVSCVVSALAVEPDGTLTVVDPDRHAEHGRRTDHSGGAAEPGGRPDDTGHQDGAPVGVDRDFLLEALAASATDQLVLELDGPIRPLAVRLPGDPEPLSILMPVQLTAAR